MRNRAPFEDGRQPLTRKNLGEREMSIKAGVVTLKGLSDEDMIEVFRHKTRNPNLYGFDTQSMPCSAPLSSTPEVVQDLTLTWKKPEGLGAIMQLLDTLNRVDPRVEPASIDFSSY